MPTKAEMRMTELAWEKLKAHTAEMKKTYPDFTPSDYLMRMNKLDVKSINERGSKVEQLPRIEIDFDGGVHDYVCHRIDPPRLKDLRARGPLKNEDKVVYEAKRATGLMLRRNTSTSAKRGSDTDEFQAKTAKRMYDYQRKYRDDGNSKSCDGSKGGIGYHDHAHLKKETINCPVVAEIQKCFAPEGSSEEDTLDGQVRGACHFLQAIHERGEVCRRARTPA